MAKTFTKVRKWTKEQGHEIEDREAYGDEVCVVIRASLGDRVLSFRLEQRESTIYHSIRGMKGDPKGMYLSVIGKRRCSSMLQSSQKEAITEMERFIAEETKKGN